MTDHDPIPLDRADLAEVLRRATSGRIEIPASLDLDLRRAMRERFRGMVRRAVWRTAGVRAAALLLLAAGLALAIGRPAAPPTAAPADFDGNGTVDILDAAALDRWLAAGRAVPRRIDLNGDGVVDDGDIRAVAQRAVALQTGAG